MHHVAGTGRSSALARKLKLLVLGASVLLSGAANASLILEPDGVVLDTTTGLEWEQNANHGPFNWAGAVAYGSSVSLDGGGWGLVQ